MAGAGALPSRQDQAEFARMTSEKVEAFCQSWSAMWLEGWAAQVKLASAALSGSVAPLQAASNAMLSVMSAGLAPVHRRAVSNAKRLSKRRK
jgi:hypothetical protein